MRISRPPLSKVTTQNHASDQQIADFLHTRLQRALARSQGGLAVAFTGDATMVPIAQRLVERELDWSRVAVFPTDDSETDAADQAPSADQLRALFEPHGALVTPLADGFDMPHFALVWLDMGADGRIASLFPGNMPNARDLKAVRRVSQNGLSTDKTGERVTLTIPSLLACDEMVFVARGQAKRAVFEAAIRGDHELPIRTLLAAREKSIAMPVTCFY